MSPTKRQNEIIDAALALTARGGARRLTVKNLAAAVGVSEPALYRHFKNKSEIVRAMIDRFDHAVPTEAGGLHGFDAVAAFVTARCEQVRANPDLAKVVFSEELFLDDPEFSGKMFQMMRAHRSVVGVWFSEARERGEIRADLAPDALFRIVMGSVRLLIKQWGMSDGAFDLRAKSAELLDTLRLILKPEVRNDDTRNH